MHAAMTVSLIPVLSDNYVFVLHGGGSGAAVVDPAVAEPVIAWLEERGHHREEQGQPPLFRRDPRRSNLRRHALGVGARDRVGDNVRGLDGLNRRQGQQVGVTGTNPHQGDCRGRAGAHGRGAQSAPF